MAAHQANAFVRSAAGGVVRGAGDGACGRAASNQPYSYLIMRTYLLKKLASLAFLTGMLLACTTNSSHISFPENETEFSPPVSRPLKFTEPRPFEWAAPDSIHSKTITTTTLDLDKIPSQPFRTDGFQPFNKPMPETRLDWDSLPETDFDFDKLPTEKLRFKVSILGKPTVVEAPDPEIRQEAESAILNLKIEQGENNVYAMVQDKDGVVWIGMRGSGLCRFDGENYHLFKEEQGLGSVMINKLCIDVRGQIWVGTLDKGVLVLDVKAGVIKHLGVKEGLGNGVIYGLMPDQQGQVWVGSWGGGVDIINEESGTIKHLKDTPSLSDNLVRSFLQERDGKIWVGTGSGADIIDRKAGKIKHLSQKAGLSNNNVDYLFQNTEDEIWIGTREKVNIIDRKKNSLKQLGREQGLSNANICSIFRDGNGQIWIGNTEDQVDVVDADKNQIRRIGAKEGLSGRYAPCMLRRGDGKIWIGTLAGINIIDESEQIHYLKPGNFFDSKIFFGLLEDSKGRVWVGTDKGLLVVHPHNNTLSYLKMDHPVYCFMEDSLGDIWIGSLNGLFVYNVKDKILRKIAFTEKASYGIYSLYEDRSRQIWIGYQLNSVGGIAVLNPRNSKLKLMSKFPSLVGATVNSFHEDGQNKVWVSIHYAGIYVLDLNSKTYLQLNDSLGLRSNYINPMIIDPAHRIWVGSDKGIDILDRKISRIVHLSTNEGLAGNLVNNLKLEGGDVLALTTKGLTTITSRSSEPEGSYDFKLKTKGKNRGFSGSIYFILPSIQRKNKEYWWGLGSYITIMPPQREDTLPRRAFITGIDLIGQPQPFVDKGLLQAQLQKVDSLWDEKEGKYVDKEVYASSIDLTSNPIQWDSVAGASNMPVNLRLPYDHNYLTFHFASPEYGDFDKTVYRYILEGQDGQWSKISEGTSSENYINLDPGTYTFKVRSKGYNQVWSEAAELRFTILPPWWQTWWAYLLYAGLFVASVLAFSKYRSRNLQRQNKQLEEKVLERTKALNESLAELKSTQSQLIQKEKLASLGELTAGIAHEIQNPLNFVNNYSEVNVELLEELEAELETGNVSEARAIAVDLRDNESKIHHHGKRADAIVRGMLEHARATPGEKVPPTFDYYRQARKVYESMGNREGVAWELSNMSDTYINLNLLDSVQLVNEQSLAMFTSLPETHIKAGIATSLTWKFGRIQFARGNAAEALLFLP